MSRLTVKGNIVSQKDINKLLEPSNKNQFGMNDAYYKLKEYEDLEEQGLLLKLPCKVGDTVYIIDKRYTKCSLYDEEYSESSCWNCDKECDSKMYYVVVKRYVGTLEWVVSRLKNFGKTVFLTKEEAEQELKRLEGAENESEV